MNTSFQFICKLTGRPNRDTIINHDDIINLHIALETRAPAGIDPLEYFLSQV